MSARARRTPAVGSGASRRRTGPLAALGLFSVLPVPRQDGAPGGRVVLWLPGVGAVLGALAFVPALAVWRGHDRGSALLAAALIVTGLALLTRGLHLDGLADLADGLGSRRPPEQARAIMRRSDVGAFGASAVGGVLLVQVAALSAVLAASPRPTGLVLLLIATVTGRVAVVQAAGRAAAPGSAFGVLVAGAVGPLSRWASAGFVLAAAIGARAALGGGAAQLAWTAAAVVAGLLVAAGVARHAVRRLGGTSGDLFGALVELATTVVLGVLAAQAAWR